MNMVHLPPSLQFNNHIVISASRNFIPGRIELTPLHLKGHKRVVVYFRKGKAVLSVRAVATLNKISYNSKVKISGYASREGVWLYNKKLGGVRANSVAKYLVGQGITVCTKYSYGASHFISKTPWRNRRVVVELTKCGN